MDGGIVKNYKSMCWINSLIFFNKFDKLSSKIYEMNRVYSSNLFSFFYISSWRNAVTKDQEFRNQTLLIIWSFPFGIHDKLFLVNLEKKVSSIFTSILKFWITFYRRIKYLFLIQFWNSSSKFISLARPFLYLISSFSHDPSNYSFVNHKPCLFIDLSYTSLEVHGILVEVK